MKTTHKPTKEWGGKARKIENKTLRGADKFAALKEENASLEELAAVIEKELAA